MFRSTIPACLLVQSQCTLKVLREPYRAPESLNLIFTGGKQDWISAFKETRLAPPFSLKRIKILLISNVFPKAVDYTKNSKKYNLYERSGVGVYFGQKNNKNAEILFIFVQKFKNYRFFNRRLYICIYI